MILSATKHESPFFSQLSLPDETIKTMSAETISAFRETLSISERQAFDRVLLEQSPHHWLSTLYPRQMYDLAEYHEQFWSWLWSIEHRKRPRPFVALWPRAAAKSTNAELSVVCLGARAIRRYAIYCCNTQEQADDHVANIATLLDHPTLASIYPTMSRPLLNKFGKPNGWRRNRLRTAQGFTIDALGLDTAARGAKVDDDRPDYIVLDDIDTETDQPGMTEKKIQMITQKLLPAGADAVAILFVQNIVHEHSIAARLAGVIPEERAEFLSDRLISGPYKAVDNAVYTQDDQGNWHITAGDVTWQGMSLARCEQIIKNAGITAFRVECQHETDVLPGGMFDDIVFQHCSWNEVPDFIRVAVWVDPAVTNTDKSDSMGIQCDALGEDGRVYRLYSWEGRTSPEDALERAIQVALDFKADQIGVETDQGGDTWLSVYERAIQNMVARGVVFTHPIGFAEDKAGAGYGAKYHRANQMHAKYEQGMFVHVTLGTHTILERALKRFPRAKPYDLVDAAFWSQNDLLGEEVFTYAIGGTSSPLVSGYTQH